MNFILKDLVPHVCDGEPHARLLLSHIEQLDGGFVICSLCRMQLEFQPPEPVYCYGDSEQQYLSREQWRKTPRWGQRHSVETPFTLDRVLVTIVMKPKQKFQSLYDDEEMSVEPEQQRPRKKNKKTMATPANGESSRKATQKAWIEEIEKVYHEVESDGCSDEFQTSRMNLDRIANTKESVMDGVCKHQDAHNNLAGRRRNQTVASFIWLEIFNSVEPMRNTIDPDIDKLLQHVCRTKIEDNKPPVQRKRSVKAKNPTKLPKEKAPSVKKPERGAPLYDSIAALAMTLVPSADVHAHRMWALEQSRQKHYKEGVVMIEQAACKTVGERISALLSEMDELEEKPKKASKGDSKRCTLDANQFVVATIYLCYVTRKCIGTGKKCNVDVRKRLISKTPGFILSGLNPNLPSCIVEAAKSRSQSDTLVSDFVAKLQEMEVIQKVLSEIPNSNDS